MRQNTATRAAALLLLGCAAVVASPGAAQSPAARSPGYRLRDGSVQVITASSLADVVSALDRLYVSTHPGAVFTMRTGDNYSAMAALTFDRSAFAPMGCEYTRIGLGDNLKIAAEPIGFRIAHAALAPGSRTPALGIIVNPANPLTSISLTQMARIFAMTTSGGEIVRWSQAGVRSALGEREVHPFGPYASDYLDSEDPQAGEFLSAHFFSGLTVNHRYVEIASYAEVVRRVSEDPAAIGITALNVPLTGVKVLALKVTETSAAIAPGPAEIASGHYPLDRFVYIYLRAGMSEPLDAFGLEYMRMVLSAPGQQAIAATNKYIPLNEAELAIERARLNQ